MITEKQHQEWKKDLEELHKLRAENKRFRDALEDIASTRISSADPNDNNVAHYYMDMAEQALKG